MAERNFTLNQMYPAPNAGLIQAMTSGKAGAYMFLVGLRVARTYSVAAPKRTGLLASSTRVSITRNRLGKYKGDRWIAEVHVTAPYAVWNITGAGPGKHRRSNPRNVMWYGPFKGAYTFSKIIKAGGAANASPSGMPFGGSRT